jgi:hypothetical protein
MLTMLALLLANWVSAQVGGTPRELTCTEEAFNFKIGIKPGWHFSAPSMGPSGLPKGTPDYIAVRTFGESLSGIEPISAGNTFISRMQPIVNLRMPRSLVLPKPYSFLLNALKYSSPSVTRWRAGFSTPQL